MFRGVIYIVIGEKYINEVFILVFSLKDRIFDLFIMFFFSEEVNF